MQREDKFFKVLVLVILIILLFISYKVFGAVDSKSSFYEYRGVKVNLAQVHKIEPRVSYYATLSSDSYEQINKQYSTKLDMNEIQNIKNFLTMAPQSDFYNIEISAYMMFDDEKIELYHSQQYIKLSKEYSVNEYLLETLQAYGIDDFQYKNLLKIKDKKYKSRDKFIDDVILYAKLRRGAWSEKEIPRLGLSKKGDKFMQALPEDLEEKLLQEKDIKAIVVGLTRAYSEYLGIQ